MTADIRDLTPCRMKGTNASEESAAIILRGYYEYLYFQRVPPKRWYSPTELPDVTFQRASKYSECSQISLFGNAMSSFC